MMHLNKSNNDGEGSKLGALTTRDAFERGTNTFNSHDMQGFAEMLADNVVFEAPGGISGYGKPGCVEFFGSWFVAFPDTHVDEHDIHILKDVAVEEGTFSATHNRVLRSPVGDVPPSGRFIRISYVHVLRFREGKHISLHLMFDRLSMLEQVGWIPTPAPVHS